MEVPTRECVWQVSGAELVWVLRSACQLNTAGLSEALEAGAVTVEQERHTHYTPQLQFLHKHALSKPAMR